ncbi:MAG: HIT family protein [Devosia sp.]
MSCVFCAIARGEAPARIVYETDAVVCFFPLAPEVLGHTLIATKAHFDDARTCPPETGAQVFAAAQLLYRHYAGALGATGFNLLSANGVDAEQSVQHLHSHFLPRRAGDGLSTWPKLPPFATDLDALHARLRVASE